MKKTLRNSILFAFTMSLSMGMASCSSDDETTTSEAAKGTDAAVEAACTTWKAARQDWEWSEAFLFGPASDYGIDPHTDTWPFNVTSFNNYMKKFHPATNESDAELIDDAIANGQNLTGFHAVEYLIFRNGSARKIADITADEAYFCQSAAKDLYLSSLKLVKGWDGTLSADEEKMLEDAEFDKEGYGENFLSAGETGSDYKTVTAATLDIIAGAQDIIGEVRDSKIGAPATGEDINYIESPHSYNSIQDFYDNIMSCKHALYGGWTVTGTPTSTSLIGYALTVNQFKTQAANVQTKMEAALTAIQNMKKPFVLYYSDQSAKNAMSALDELDEALQALSSAIEPYAGNATMENDFKKINEVFVTNTVRPTYRALADNDKKLVEALGKITW